MDWGKVDAPLASALAGASGDEPLPVFVKIDRSRADLDGDVLDRLGLGPDPADLSTATLSPAQLDALTEKDWVLFVRLSGRLRLLREPEAPLAPPGQQEARGGHQPRPPQQEKGKPGTS